MIFKRTNAIDKLTPADYIAALPVLLRYVPEDRLCVLFIRAGRIDMVVAAEIDQDHDAFALHLARIADSREMDAVRVVLVASARRAGAGIWFADAVREQVDAHGIPVLSRAHTYALTRGAVWTDLDNHTQGHIPDPATTAAAVTAVSRGMVVLEARADIEARYTPVETPDFMARRAACLHSKQRGFATSVLREVAELVTRYDYPPAALAARVSILVTIDPAARDALLGIALLDMNAAASSYVDIANQCRGEARAYLLATAAALFYITGQGVASLEAIRHAEDAARKAKAENLSLINFVTTAHARAIRPEFVRRFLAAGQIAATKYGVKVPDYTP
ncbi:DUF4192 family protein [Nocardia sp. NPDC004260]